MDGWKERRAEDGFLFGMSRPRHFGGNATVDIMPRRNSIGVWIDTPDANTSAVGTEIPLKVIVEAARLRGYRLTWADPHRLRTRHPLEDPK